jgi:glutamate/tyrosine decarboxylase-like PLP-dependent enzyme
MAKEGTRTKGSTRRSRPTQKAATAVATRHEDIARRAFELYLARGAGDGEALADWVQAERELLGMQ